MYEFEPEEAQRVFALSDELTRRGGLGDVIFKVDTSDGRIEEGHIVEIDGESSRDGVLLGGMPPDNKQRFLRFDEMIWIALGFLE